jgi:hypothetical protein
MNNDINVYPEIIRISTRKRKRKRSTHLKKKMKKFTLSHGEKIISDNIYCLCKGPETNKILGCSKESCKSWKHYSCIGFNSSQVKRVKIWYCCHECGINK